MFPMLLYLPLPRAQLLPQYKYVRTAITLHKHIVIGLSDSEEATSPAFLRVFISTTSNLHTYYGIPMGKSEKSLTDCS